MIKRSRFSSLLWLAAPLGALAFVVWINAARIQHLTYLSALGGWDATRPAGAANVSRSSSEFAPGNRLIIPEHLTNSYHWLAQTQRMFQQKDWRVRHIDYENAPSGHPVYAASPYRWWLGVVAWCDHAMSDRSPGESVERAALIADPLLQVLLLVGTSFFVAWRFGFFAAGLVSIGVATLFPFAAAFLAGAPDDHGLKLIFNLWSVLLLVAGIDAARVPIVSEQSSRRWFFIAGIAGGLGLWLSVSWEVPVLAGIAVGALLAAWIARGASSESGLSAAVLPWRAWALGGAITTLVAYLIEFAPAHLGTWQLSSIHPLYGLAWLGAGELLATAAEWIQQRKRPNTLRQLVVLTLAAAAIAAAPFAIWKTHGRAFLVPDAQSFRLTRLPDGSIAQSLGAWLSRDGLNSAVVAVLLPLFLIIPAVVLLTRRQNGSATRAAVALALGPVVVALGFACRQLIWWNAVDGLLLVLLVAATATSANASRGRSSRIASCVLLGAALFPGVLRIALQARAASKVELTQSELFGLIERDLGSWLALHADPTGATVLAPPGETTALCYFGAMRGMGSVSWENKEGVAAAVRILSAPTAQEARELIERRGITHIVLLSWDSNFDDFARAGTGQIAGTFRDQLRLQTLPAWLRPMAYQLPTIPGFEGQSVTIFEVVEEQDEATALSRITEYLIEQGDLDQAALMAQGLRRFPAEFGAAVARAEVELARGDDAAFSKSLKGLQARLAGKNVPVLAWDQRVALAVVLAKAKQPELAQQQARLCLAAADEAKLRALSSGSLYRLLVLSRAFGVTLDSKLREFALNLLPADQRERLR